MENKGAEKIVKKLGVLEKSFDEKSDNRVELAACGSMLNVASDDGRNCRIVKLLKLSHLLLFKFVFCLNFYSQLDSYFPLFKICYDFMIIMIIMICLRIIMNPRQWKISSKNEIKP